MPSRQRYQTARTCCVTEEGKASGMPCLPRVATSVPTWLPMGVLHRNPHGIPRVLTGDPMSDTARSRQTPPDPTWDTVRAHEFPSGSPREPMDAHEKSHGIPRKSRIMCIRVKVGYSAAFPADGPFLPCMLRAELPAAAAAAASLWLLAHLGVTSWCMVLGAHLPVGFTAVVSRRRHNKRVASCGLGATHSSHGSFCSKQHTCACATVAVERKWQV